MTEAATVRRSRITPEREAELYRAVLDLLREVGYDALTMDAVAARTKSSKATLYRQWGAEVIGMTAMPEARLAREAELPFALLGMVTDYDCWREGAAVEVSAVLDVMRGNAQAARAALRHLVKKLPAERAASPIDSALDGAIVTPREQWEAQAIARLDAVAGRLFRSD